jgi:MFS transporter, DHA1 family, multidrug resistance protein
VLRCYGRLLRDRTLVGYAMIGGFGIGAVFAYVTGAPTVLTARYGLSPQQFGWLIALNGLAFMLASQLNIRALHSMSPNAVLARYIWAPLTLSATLLLAALLWPIPLWIVVALQLCLFVGVARINPNVAALALGPHGREAGAASAAMGALQSLIPTIAGVAVAFFNDGTVVTLASIMTVGAAGAVACYLWVRRR